MTITASGKTYEVTESELIGAIRKAGLKRN